MTSLAWQNEEVFRDKFEPSVRGQPYSGCHVVADVETLGFQHSLPWDYFPFARHPGLVANHNSSLTPSAGGERIRGKLRPVAHCTPRGILLHSSTETDG